MVAIVGKKQAAVGNEPLQPAPLPRVEADELVSRHEEERIRVDLG